MTAVLALRGLEALGREEMRKAKRSDARKRPKRKTTIVRRWGAHAFILSFLRGSEKKGAQEKKGTLKGGRRDSGVLSA